TTYCMSASMTIPSSNFRQSLISKVNVQDESVKLEQILSGERDVEIFQLKQFVWKYSLPDKSRYDVWRLLLGVSSGHTQIRATVDKHRNDEAESLWRSLKTMRMAEGREEPVPSDIVRMILLAGGRLKDGIDFRTLDVAPIVTIVHHMRIVAGFNRWREAFSLSRAAHRLFLELFPQHVIDHIHTEVWKAVDTDGVVLSPHMMKMYVESGGAALFKSPKALHKLWDKVVSGGESPPFLMTQLLISYLNNLTVRISLRSPMGSNVVRRELDAQSPFASQSSNSSQCSLKGWNVQLSEEDEMRLVGQSTEAVLRKPNFKMPDPSSSSSLTNNNNQYATTVAGMIRGETLRRSEGCDRPLPSPILVDASIEGENGYVTPAKAKEGKEWLEDNQRKRAATVSEAKLRSPPIM
ncbi:hypothetical protein PFISCL1PPCAC_15732, partial [Pristionchus fissidentatus]